MCRWVVSLAGRAEDAGAMRVVVWFLSVVDVDIVAGCCGRQDCQLKRRAGDSCCLVQWDPETLIAKWLAIVNFKATDKSSETLCSQKLSSSTACC